MAKTMYWRVVPGAVHVVVHTDEAPTDEEWDAYLEDVTKHVDSIRGVLVYTNSAGPSAAQRSRSSELFKKHEVDISTVIMTNSRMVKGIVTALSWAVGSKIKAFSSLDFEGAAKHLGLDGEEQIRTRVVLRQLARGAGQQIDAFADESGRFRKKFSGGN